MDEPRKNVLREPRQTFNFAGAGPQGQAAASAGKTHRVKVFKSGNSLALRLPKALGLEAGMELELQVSPSGEYLLKRADAPKRRIDGSKFIGKCPGLKELPRYEFEDSPRDWHLLDPDWRRA